MKHRTKPYLAAFLAGLVAIVFAFAAVAAPVAVTADFGDGDYLSLTPDECTQPDALKAWEPIRAQLRAQHGIELELHASRLVWKGIEYAGCYAIGPDNGYVYNIDSTGDKLQPVPPSLFVPGDRPKPPLPKGGREASLTEAETYAMLARDLAQLAEVYAQAWREFHDNLPETVR